MFFQHTFIAHMGFGHLVGIYFIGMGIALFVASLFKRK